MQENSASDIDAETWAFIRRSESFYPADTAGTSIERQREIYNTMCRAFYQGRPAGLAVEGRAIGGVPCRIYGAGAASVIYFHGGGYVVGGLDSHDDICAEIGVRCGYRVISVDYRLSPEHLHPAAFEDALAAIRAAAAEFGGPMVLVGDSAGGNLAAAAALALRGEALGITGQVLIYPGLGGDTARGSYITQANAPMLTRDDVIFYAGIRFAGGAAPGPETTASPLAASSLQGLPPALIISAACDPLCDDGRDYRNAIRASGGKAHWVCETGLVHAYLRARTSVGRARDSFTRICQGIEALGRSEWLWQEEDQ